MAILKLSSVLLALACISATSAFPHNHRSLRRQNSNGFIAPAPGDSRGPCPALNVVANHGYMNRNGQNLTIADITNALSSGLNVDPLMGGSQAFSAITSLGHVDPVSGQSVLDLANLDKHNALEHDASLTRLDAANGDAINVNANLVSTLLSFSTDNQTLTVDQMAAYRNQRDLQSQAADPSYSASIMATFQKYHEASQLLTVMTDASTGAARTDWMKVWLGEERLPTELGWVQPPQFGWPSTLALATEIRAKTDAIALAGGKLQI